MPHRSLLERYQIGPPTTTIALKDHLDQWDDASLAKVMRIILDAAKSSHVALAPTGESKGVTVRVDLSAEHAGALRQVMADESRKEHRGIKLVPELLSRDLGINRSKSTEFSYNITTDVIDGFMPVILGITPVDRERPSDEQE